MRTVVMTAMPPVVLPALELDDQHLGAFALGDHLAGDPGTGQRRRLHRHVPLVVEEQNLVELDRAALGHAEALDLDHLAWGHSILLATRRDHRFHGHSALLEWTRRERL
jgi:hypothetical protein